MSANKETSKGLVDLIHLDQLNEIDRLSFDGKVFIVKHSSRCGISHAAMEHVDSFVSKQEDFHFYYLDLLTYRPVSNAIAGRYSVPHSSPQVLVIHYGKSIRHATHYAIDERWLHKARF